MKYASVQAHFVELEASIISLHSHYAEVSGEDRHAEMSGEDRHAETSGEDRTELVDDGETVRAGEPMEVGALAVCRVSSAAVRGDMYEVTALLTA